jgi:anti-sigma regulatory factor (Ser/Thr protein kinase)
MRPAWWSQLPAGCISCAPTAVEALIRTAVDIANISTHGTLHRRILTPSTPPGGASEVAAAPVWPNRYPDRGIAEATLGYALDMNPLPPPTASTEQLVCAGDADAATAAQLRRYLDLWLQHSVQGPTELRDDVVLSVNEALANCVEHAYRDRRGVGTVKLQANYDCARQSLSIAVSDRGSWHRPVPRRADDPRASRGIMLMHALADHCIINAQPGGTTVCLNYSTRSSDRDAQRAG